MAHRLSFRPSLTLKGRKFFGPLRGAAGKPVHPPLTDIPSAAYMFAAEHPEVLTYWGRKVADYDRWLAGMRRLQDRIVGPAGQQ